MSNEQRIIKLLEAQTLYQMMTLTILIEDTDRDTEASKEQILLIAKAAGLK